MASMIQHIKLLSVFIYLLIFTTSCKENKTRIDKINKQNIIAKQKNTTYNWQFLNAFTLDNSMNEISNSKFENLKFKITKDSIFIENIGKEAIYSGKSNTKKYFNSIYDYVYLKRFLSEKFNIKIENSINHIRNKHIYEKNTILKSYFGDAFIIDNLLFLMSEENIIVYTNSATLKNRPNKENNKSLQQKNKLIKDDDELLINDNIITEKNYKKTLNFDTFTKSNKPINIEEYLCDKEYPIKYYTLSQSKEYTNILFEEICGDFNVTNLIILKKNKIISNLAIETEWFEPESYKEYHEKTTFKIVKKTIKLVKQTFENEKIKSTTIIIYKITKQGKIEKVKQ